ncbi:site-specific integrase [Acidithiobacillus thiooxidans]|uniref:tyrosine-type recombinase/integrase n=1 Tax=Acidithiobacillus thiooxidans TaxID=930 RepID=UPI001C071446|nr:site-specific integrase [Acidithiobacillus thiooxidans]MBU2837967.1 site-specific integrase [Acidithiobacillus thiooxidans]
MASIQKRGKYWRVQIRKQGYPALSSTFDTKAEAQLWAVQQEKKLAEQSPAQVVKRMQDGSFTLQQAFDRYVQEILPSKKPTTQARDKGNIQRICRDYGEIALAKIDGQALSGMIRQWSGHGLGANTIRIYLANLSHLYNMARKEWGMLELVNPVELVRKPKLPQGRDRRLVGDEEDRLLAACAATNPELADIVLFAIETAMRQGEIISMEWRRVNWIDHTVFMPYGLTKTDTARVVPLSEKAQEVLQRQQERVTGKDGKVWKYTNDGLRAVYKRSVKRAGIEGLTFHDLRHEATSRLVEKGIPIMTVQAITGHKSTQMMKRYTHISDKVLVDAVRGSKQDH